MLGNKTFRAQSAMEYLMTYGWAILIIAVVLGALFSLGVFSGSSLLGTSCVAAPGFLCQNPSLNTAGLLSFTFGQNTGSQIYSMEMACAATANSAGLPGNTAAWNAISANVATIGYPQPPTPLYYANALSLVSGQEQQITNLPCYGSSGTQLASPNPSAIGTPFSGFIWLNYTTQGACTSTTSCNWFTVKAATITIKVV